MKLSFGRVSFSDVAIFAGVLALCGVLLAQNSKNPIQVALLRWYSANTVTAFTTCATPSILAFDGKHVWVACGSTGELQEYDASDGAPVATVTSVLNTGVFFSSLLYDGRNIWAAGNNSASAAVVRVNVAAVNSTAACSLVSGCSCPSLGTGCAGVTNVGAGATGMTFDGSNVWVANGNANNLSQIVANAPSPAATTVSFNTTCTQPLFLAFDGASVWVPCRKSNSVQLVKAVSPSQQTVLSGTASPSGLAYDGNNMWVSSSSGAVYEISPSGSSYAVSSAYSVPGGGGGGIAFDGKFLWVGDYSTAMVTKLLLGGPISSGAPPNVTLVNTYSGGLANPESPAFDGGNIWFANSGGNTVSKF